ncbi:glycine betaine ABC transporter substrate-binding protein [Rubrobacter taiwanensis]|uniref:Glycine betaine ABC transporter substrate-binding protein n=1 Tax=Rubrobacter taiwanensis TaxID=185139 RepID=A0A4R1BSI1_9ACTN|nr:glycine betaine ABC transporter substrate-binding protein [Rubrobacter taiwanensis]TCJ20588.1 glycine betaine ABC transporter substrate-binding protein [Rubrobacter taiwanensis]
MSGSGVRALVAAAALILLAPACGTAGSGELSEVRLAVGSKEFTEQLLLGQITILALENAGAEVADQTGITGSVAVREALLIGEIDMYWEYTGTGWTVHLGETEPPDTPEEQYEAVAERDLEENGIRWLPPAPANSTYAFAVRSEAAEELGVEKVSDFGRLIQEDPQAASLCIGTEFATRDDGLPGVEQAYGFEWPEQAITRMDEGQIYQAVDRGNPCNFGEVLATDGRIAALGLTIIEDDRNFFPVYNPSLNVRQEALQEHPAIEEIFAPISEALTTETLQDLNARIDVEGELPETVAEDWLRENGFIE